MIQFLDMKFILFFSHLFISYLLSIVLGFVLILTGVFGLIYSDGVTNVIAEYVSIFIVVGLSAKIISHLFPITKNDIKFVLTASLVMGLLVTITATSDDLVGPGAGSLMHISSGLIVYFVSTIIFLKPKKSV